MPRQSAAVYRRRRLAVLLVALLVIAVLAAGVWLAITQPWATEAEPEAPTTPVASQTPLASQTPDASAQPTSASPTPTPTPPEASQAPKIVACDVANIVVTPRTDADTYRAGEKPELSIALKNIGTVDCTMDVGSSTQKLIVTSGSDTWWRSTDCQTKPSSLIVTLKAGEEVTSAKPVIWDRTRSSVDSCKDKTRPRAPGGGASYHLSVEIGGFQSAAPKQFLLN